MTDVESSTFTQVDRILWNRRPDNSRDAGDIDEIVLHDVKCVHIEQMDSRVWWIALYMDEGAAAPYWMGNFVADSRGRMSFCEQEDNGIEWDRDEEHET